MSCATATCPNAPFTVSACSAFKPARQCHQRLRRARLVARAARQSSDDRCSKSLAEGLAALASVPLLFSGPALAFVGNTAQDFSEKVDRYTPSISDIQDVTSTKVEQATPDVPLPGLNQKGKEASAIGKAPAQSGPGATDQVQGVADDAKGALKDAAPQKGLFGRIKDEALTPNSPSVQINK